MAFDMSMVNGLTHFVSYDVTRSEGYKTPNNTGKTCKIEGIGYRNAVTRTITVWKYTRFRAWVDGEIVMDYTFDADKFDNTELKKTFSACGASCTSSCKVDTKTLSYTFAFTYTGTPTRRLNVAMEIIVPVLKILDRKYLPDDVLLTGEDEIILTSPNGTKYKLVIDDAGAFSTTPVTE